jgi:hypothetical protein
MGQHVLCWFTALLVFAALLAPANAPLGTAASKGTATTAVSAAARIAPVGREDKAALGGVSVCRCGGVTRPLRLQTH